MNLNIFQWQSLKTRVTLLTLAIFVTGIWSLSLYGRWILREDMTRRLGEQQLSTARIVATAINNQLDLRFQALNEAAKVLAPFMLKGASLQMEFARQTTLTLLFNGGAVVLDPDGTTIADLPLSAGRIGNNYIDKEWNRVVLKEGKSTIGEPIIGKALGMPIFSMAVPIRDSRGKVIGALSGVVNLGKPNFLDVIPNGNYGVTGGFQLVAPQYRLIVTASDKSRTMEQLAARGVSPVLDRSLEGGESTNFFVNARGIEVLASSSVIPVSGWHVVVSLPTGEAFAPIRELQQRILLITLLLTFLAGGLTWWILRRQLSPLTDAATTLTKFSNSEQALGALPVARRDEVGKLIEGFNGLLGTLIQREEALRDSEARFRKLTELSSDWYWEQDRELRLSFLSSGFERHSGTTSDNRLGKRRWEEPNRFPLNGTWEEHRAVLEAHKPFRDFEYVRIGDDGKQMFGSLSGEPMFDAAGQFNGYRGVGTNITEQKRATHAQQEHVALIEKSAEQDRLLRLFYDLPFVGLAVTSPNSKRWLQVNNRMCEMLGYPREELLQLAWTQTTHPDDLPGNLALFKRLVAGEFDAFHYDKRFLRKDGGIVDTSMEVRCVRGPDGSPETVVIMVQDITERKQMEEQVRQLAFHDALTNLPNRRLLNDRLSQAMAAGKRSGHFGALMFIDLDNFKPLNDSHGHGVGDLLLIEVARRIDSRVREADTVSRFGGDEFVVLLSELGAERSESARQAGTVAEHIRTILAQPYVLKLKREGEAETIVEHRCTASIGIALFIKHESSAEDVLKWADTAMYQAKEAGRNSVRFFNSDA